MIHTILNKSDAPGEARTHGLQIMRLTRCLLRYGGTTEASSEAYSKWVYSEKSICLLYAEIRKYTYIYYFPDQVD